MSQRYEDKDPEGDYALSSQAMKELERHGMRGGSGARTTLGPATPKEQITLREKAQRILNLARETGYFTLNNNEAFHAAINGVRGMDEVSYDEVPEPEEPDLMYLLDQIERNVKRTDNLIREHFAFMQTYV